MEIRKAQQKDVRRISYLIRKNTDKVLENQYTTAQKRIWKKSNTPKAIERSMDERVIFCAFEHDKMVGTIALKDNEVMGLYVSYTKRKQGVGKRLLQYLENYARQKKIKTLTLTSTPSGKAFYHSNGYNALQAVIVKIEGVEFYETAMQKTL